MACRASAEALAIRPPPARAAAWLDSSDTTDSLQPVNGRCLSVGRPRKRRPSFRSTCAGCPGRDRKSTRLNSSHLGISYAVFCLKKKNKIEEQRKTLEEPVLNRPEGEETNRLDDSPDHDDKDHIETGDPSDLARRLPQICAHGEC